MAQQRRVIFLNRFFYPDHSPTSELLSDVAFALAERGFEVSVVTSRQRYDAAQADLAKRETVRAVDIKRVWTSRRGRAQLAGRSVDYLTYYAAAAWHVLRSAHSGDVVVAKTDPPLLSVVLAPIAKLKGADLVNWLQDVFPEVAERLNTGGSGGRFFARAVMPIRNWSLKSAKMNVVVGDGMAAQLKAQGIPEKLITVINNWADASFIRPVAEQDNQLRKEWIPDGRFVVAYAGNLGRAHDVDTILSAMTLLQDRAVMLPNDVAAKVIFLFVGGGAKRAKLEREAMKRGLTNFRVRQYQPKERLSETLGVGDVHLVSLDPRLEGLIVPSKFYGIAAAGRPTIFVGSSLGEIARMIAHHRCGYTVSPDDGEALADRIQQLASNRALCSDMGARAREAFEAHWEKTQALAKWEEILLNVRKAKR
jgi:glycosyltransferase involved in cell wall biosynthesis